MYRADHIKVLKVLSAELPKRPALKTSDVVAKAFKRAENGDRRVRNAYRKLRKEGHAEIGERGEYRLTQAGAFFCKKAEADNWKPEPPKKATKKKATKKATKKKATKKKATKKATKKKVAKKATSKKRKVAPGKKVTKKSAAAENPPKKATGSNTMPKSPPKDSSVGATLTF